MASLPPLPPPPNNNPSTDAPLTSAEKRKARNKRSARAIRKRKRVEERDARETKGPAGYELRPRTRSKHFKKAEGLGSEYAGEEFPIAKTGYVAVRQSKSSTAYRLSDLVGPKSRFRFDLVEWDGR